LQGKSNAINTHYRNGRTRSSLKTVTKQIVVNYKPKAISYLKETKTESTINMRKRHLFYSNPVGQHFFPDPEQITHIMLCVFVRTNFFVTNDFFANRAAPPPTLSCTSHTLTHSHTLSIIDPIPSLVFQNKVFDPKNTTFCLRLTDGCQRIQDACD
jgi:hypothetical protein